MSSTLLHLFIQAHNDVRPLQLTMHMVRRRTKTSEVIMWELGVIHQLDTTFTGLLLGCACIILSVLLSQDAVAILGRTEWYDARCIEPKFQKWWWQGWTCSSIHVESTWNVASVEMKEFEGTALSNPYFSGWCSLLQTLQKSWSHSRDLGILFLGIC